MAQAPNGINFSDDPDHCPDPGVRSPKSGFIGLSNYQRILMKFYGKLGCGLETNWLHFADDPHHYPYPRVRSGSRSGSGKNCHNSIMMAFGGGLCSQSTSSFNSCIFHLRMIVPIFPLLHVQSFRPKICYTSRPLLYCNYSEIYQCVDMSVGVLVAGLELKVWEIFIDHSEL